MFNTFALYTKGSWFENKTQTTESVIFWGAKSVKKNQSTQVQIEMQLLVNKGGAKSSSTFLTLPATSHMWDCGILYWYKTFLGIFFFSSSWNSCCDFLFLPAVLLSLCIWFWHRFTHHVCCLCALLYCYFLVVWRVVIYVVKQVHVSGALWEIRRHSQQTELAVCSSQVDDVMVSLCMCVRM